MAPQPQSDVSGPLQHPFAKLKRARRHLAEFESTFTEYVRKTPPSASAEVVYNADMGWAVKMELHNESFPDELSAIFGDVIHNLRASLDLAVCECVRLNGASDKGVLFPFCDNSKDLDMMIKQRKLTRAHPEVIKYIISLAPYKGGNIPLRALHDLDVRDKHHAMIPQALNFASPVIQIRETDGSFCNPPRIVGDPNTALDIKIVFPDDTPFAKEEVIPTLHNLASLVDSIVTALSNILATAHSA